MNIENQKFLITGGSRGIGAGIAQHLARQGARVALTYTSRPEAAEAVKADLPGDGHLVIKMDVADAAEVQSGISQVMEVFGGIDGLVNNAGITRDQLLLRMKDEDFAAVIQTNLQGTYLCTKAVLKPMMKARKGSIVNITSVVGQMGNAGQSSYAASKAGIEAFAKSIAKEVASRGIRVNCVAPGFIVTDMTDELSEEQKRTILAGIPLARLGQVGDIASAVHFLLSNQSNYITGQTISVNGGMYM